jgi:hypothetical protein
VIPERSERSAGPLRPARSGRRPSKSTVVLFVAFAVFLGYADWRGADPGFDVLGLHDSSLCQEWAAAHPDQRKGFLKKRSLKTIGELRTADELCAAAPYATLRAMVEEIAR